MMRSNPVIRSERGAALIVSLIMLVLITALVASTFTLSSTNLKSVTNTQQRAEAIAAANSAIEQVISSPFTDAPAAEQINVDINNDGVTDYLVTVATPACVSSTTITPAAPPASSLINLPTSFASANSSYYDTVWDIDATATDPPGALVTGASVEIHQGVRVLLTQTQHDAVCP